MYIHTAYYHSLPGIAFIEYETQEGVDAALKFDGTEYAGRTINVAKAGEAGPKANRQ